MLLSGFVFLLALMIGLSSYWITLSIVLTGFVLLLGGFVSSQEKYRWMGLAWLFLAIIRVFFIDLLTLAMPYKIVLFLVLGITLLAGSFGYNLLARKTGGSLEKQTFE
jgi:hypothetical protein